MGITIKDARTNAGLSKTEAACMLNISRFTLNNYEKRYTYPDVGTARKMSEIYNVNFDDLIFSSINIALSGKGRCINTRNDKKDQPA